ncbi:hypothetical protein [Sinomonas humi]|uniref:Uncharacterized protein n=1 Tax=Sinomonas humi TaxID=1338436 RepID=A0A0B2AR06_9MICC|nr:hypothetical protein [Sinomonas humi]KHL04409.1 hypothetical protein LK10_05825 [Sinomonas humi]
MFANGFIVTALLCLSGAAALACAVQVFRARSGLARVDESGRFLIAATVLGIGAGWARFAPMLVGAVLAAVLLWFVARIGLGLRGTGAEDRSGTGTAAFRSLITLSAGWVLISVARDGVSATHHPANQLGVIILDLLAAVVLLITAIGWVLATFAVPAESKDIRVPRSTGITEALLAAALAVAFFAIA